MKNIDIVASMTDATVVAEYVPEKITSAAYQSEAALEDQFIKLLVAQKYEYLPIHKEIDLLKNLRKQLEALNGINFSDADWDKFYLEYISNENLDIEKKTETIQVDYIKHFVFEDGSEKNIKLIDKNDIYNNKLQVINQYENNDGTHKNRYDVTILVNGLPLVHVELKRRGVQIREAFNQIKRYEKESFWASSGLYNFVQIFVVSNGVNTKYYSNTTRFAHIDEERKTFNGAAKKTSNSFEFTSYWTDAKNKPIRDIIDFTKTFLTKTSLLNMLTKYCVFTEDKNLLIMRPYQVVATEKILNKIKISENYKTYGSIAGGGYVWHTTGSGKTLTSFKTAQLAAELNYIDKVLFVVDRKDLDYQTIREYNRYEEGAADGNTSTNVLKRQLENRDKEGHYHNYKILVTTIQKLESFVKKYPDHEIYNKRVVLIFDECHRSQFGEMHQNIVGYKGPEGTRGKTGAFKKYNLFGFTGTPIFSENARTGTEVTLRTTEQAFGEKLHTYTIVDAIHDENVLPFRIDYVPTMSEKDEEDLDDVKISAIDKEKAFKDKRRISLVTEYILKNFDKQTKQSGDMYVMNRIQNIAEVAQSKNKTKENKLTVFSKGFNSIFAVSSIEMARLYYEEFKKQIANRGRKLRIATIFSFAANEEADGILDEENPDSISGLDQTSKEFLDKAIEDYCEMFNCKGAYDTSSDKFSNYYKDISLRMKNKEIDILIVVNMFLTGFDATTLNTLWVDKNLKQHGLIQAFSRTNRILNSVKKFGNIICFRRKLRGATDDAIALFGDKDAHGIVLLKTFKEYYEGYEDEQGKHEGYIELVSEIHKKFPLGEEIYGEENEKEFIKLFGKILRLRNILSAFNDFEGAEIFDDYEYQNYTGEYLDLYDKWRPMITDDKEEINDDIVFEIGLVQQVEVNIDYILSLVKNYHDDHCKDKEILGVIDKAIGSSTQLRSKKELIKEFIGDVETGVVEVDNWVKYVNEKEQAELEAIIKEDNLKPEETKRLVENAFKDGYLKTIGQDVDSILPPMSRFNSARKEKKQSVVAKLLKFFEKFFGII